MSLLTRDFLAPFRRRPAPAARSPLADPPVSRARDRGRKNRLAERLSRRGSMPFGRAESLERRLALTVDVAQITGNGFFFVDTGQGRLLDSEYSGYSITNNDPVTYADVWVQAHDFTGGVIDLSPNEDGVYHLGQLDPGEVDRAWFYLSAAGGSLTPQSHQISVYEGDPREGGTLISGPASFTFDQVEETIEASSNKVFTVSYDTATPVLGGTLAMTVTGNLGQAGGDSVLFTPDTFNTWQPGVFELETMTIEITGTNARTVTDELFLTGFAQASDNPYTAVYTFRIVDVIATETPVSPTQFVGRNTQWKHDQPPAEAFPPVPAVTNPLTLEKLVAADGSIDPPAPAITIPDTGETVEFTLTFTNSSMLPASLDSIRDTLPPGAVYVPGSSTFGGLPLGDPTISGSDLSWLGPFAVPPMGTATLTFDAVMPAITGVYVNSSVGRIGSVQIDTTANTKDDAPATATVTVAKFADLAITKTDGQASEIPGTSLIYTIVVSNAGPSDVSNVPVTDLFPGSLEAVSWAVVYAGGASGPAMGMGDIDVLLDMPAGSSATFTVTTTIDEAATGTLLNTANVGVPMGVFDPDLSNNTASDSTLLVPTGDLAITKTDGQTTDVPGTSLVYTIVVTNPGPSAVTGALVNDAFPPELTDVNWSATYIGGSGPMMGTGSLVDVPVDLTAGGTATFTVMAMIAGTARGTLSNTATVTAPPGFTDPDLANNSATDETILLPEADLAVVKTRTSGDPVAGAAVEYLITVTNDGPSTILGFTLLDTTAPALIGATFGTPSMGSYDPATGAWTGLMLATGESVSITLSGTVPGEARGDLVNTADVLPPAGVIDPDLDNNTSIVTDMIVLVSDLAVTKVRTSDPPVAGLPVTYEIEVTNNGPTTVMGFTLTDTTAPNLIGATFGTPSDGSYDPVTGAWTGLMLATGQSVSITLTGTVPPASVGLLENTAEVEPPPDVTDPILSNNTAIVTDVITGEADLAVVKARTSGEPVVAGAAVEYLITVTNNGPSTILGFTLSDTTAPALDGATFGAPSMGSYNPATGAWTGLMLATGESVSITLTGTVPGVARGDLVNTAEVEPPAGVIDPTPDDNTFTVTDAITLVADLNVVKIRTSGQPVAGEAVTYQITVTNQGPTTIDSFTGIDTTTPALESPTYTVSVGTYDEVTGIWTGPALATGASVVFTLTGTVPAGATGSLVNTATVSPPDGVTDPDPSDDSSTVTDDIDLVADLVVVKTRTSGDPVAGAAVEYSITVTNDGPSTILGFTLLDTTAPALEGATFGAPSMGSYNPVTGAWTGLMLATGESVSITLTGTVPGAARGDLENTAVVAPPAGVTDPDLDNNTSIVTDVLALVADLNVVKIRTSGQPVAGEAVTYQITVTNQGPTTIDSFTGIDTTTPALESPTYTVSVGTYDEVTGIWTGPALATGATVVFTLTGTVPADATGLLVNTATVSPPDGVTDPDPSDDSSTVTDEIDLVSDLAVTKARTSGDPVVAGAAVEYLITVTNDGPSTIVGFTLTDTAVPALIGATFGVPSMGSYDPATGAWTGLMLATGESVTISFSGTVPGEARGDLDNTVVVAPPPDVTDPDPDDNTFTVTDAITLVADLNVVKIRTSGQPVAGEAVTYQITVTNQGPTTIDSFTGIDTTTPALESPTYTVSVGTYDELTGIWTGPALATGATVVFTLTGTVPADATGLLVNTATVSPPDGVTDPDPSDDSSTVTDEIDLVADLGVVKTRTSGQPVAGLPVTYEIVVTNFGPSSLMTFTGTDTSTPMLEDLVFAVSTGSYDPDTGLWTADPGDSFATGETVTFTLTGTLAASATGLLVNTATGQPPAGVVDPNQDNNTSTVTDEIVGQIDLTATKTGDETYKGGGFLNFTVVVTNQGPSFASGVRVTDALPAGVVSWSWTVSYTGDGSGTADGSPDSATDSTDPIDKLIDLAVLGTATFEITALTDEDFESDITNAVVASIGQEVATASWTSAYDGPINPTQDVAALVVSNDDLCDGPPLVRLLEPETGAVVSQFLAYEPSFRGSVRVATGDLTGDGIDEIVVAPGRNRVGQIRVFTPEGVELTQYRTFAFGPQYRGGVDVAVGDIDGNGVNEIIASRTSGLTRVNVFGVDPLAADPVADAPIRRFLGLPAFYRNGGGVTVGDYGTFVNGLQVSADPDGIDEIAIGSNAGIRAQVRVFDAATTPRLIQRFFAFGAGFRRGVTLSTAQWDGVGAEDIIVGAGVGGRSVVEIYGGTGFSQLARLNAFSSFARPNAAVNTAALDLDGDGVADDLYGVQGRGGTGGSRGVRRYDRISTDTATLPASTVLAPPLRIAPITLRILAG
jgi:uncharacterized repeat protein (TIGR01451 family)